MGYSAKKYYTILFDFIGLSKEKRDELIVMAYQLCASKIEVYKEPVSAIVFTSRNISYDKLKRTIETKYPVELINKALKGKELEDEHRHYIKTREKDHCIFWK